MSAREVTGYRVTRQFPDGRPQPASVFDDVDRHEVSERGDLVVWASGDPVVRYTVAHGHWTAAMPVITQPIEDISVGRLTAGTLNMTLLVNGKPLDEHATEVVNLAGLLEGRGCECGCADDEDEPESDAVELAEKALDLARRKAEQMAMECAHANQAATDDVSEAMAALILAKRDAA